MRPALPEHVPPSLSQRCPHLSTFPYGLHDHPAGGFGTTGVHFMLESFPTLEMARAAAELYALQAVAWGTYEARAVHCGLCTARDIVADPRRERDEGR